jgi:hypothetical protein
MPEILIVEDNEMNRDMLSSHGYWESSRSSLQW